MFCTEPPHGLLGTTRVVSKGPVKPWKKFHCFYVDAKKNRCFHLTAHEPTKTAMDSSLASGLDFHHLPPPTRLVIDKSPLVSTNCHVQSIAGFLWSAGVWGGFPWLPLSKLFDASEKSSHGNHHFYTCDLLKNPEPLVDNRDIHY